MDFATVLERLCAALQQEGIDFALIGGLALAARGAPRATGDLDLLVHGEAAAPVHAIMTRLGYTARYRTENVANYVSSSSQWGNVDFLFAHRPYSRAMLARTSGESVLGGFVIPILQTEDLIGLKVQSSSNDPRRATLDLADIERLLAVATDLDLARIRDYFRLFDRESELDEILARVRSC